MNSIRDMEWKIEPVYTGDNGDRHFGQYQFCEPREYRRDEAEENAKLMSAAPALAFACRYALDMLDARAQPKLQLLVGVLARAVELSGTHTTRTRKAVSALENL